MGKKKDSKKKKGSVLSKLVKSTVGDAADGKGGGASSSGKRKSSSSKHHSSTSDITSQSPQGAAGHSVSLLVPKIAAMDSAAAVDETQAPEAKGIPAVDETLAPEAKGSAAVDEILAPETKGSAVVDETQAPEAKDGATVDETLAPEAKDSAAVDETLAPEAKDGATVDETLVPEAKDSAAVDETLAPEAKDRAAVDETLLPEAKDGATVDETLAPEAKDRAAVDETLVPEAKDGATVDETLTPEAKDSAAVDGSPVAEATWSPNSKGDAAEQTISSPDSTEDSVQVLIESPSLSRPSASNNSSEEITIETAASGSASSNAEDIPGAAANLSPEPQAESPQTIHSDSFTSAVESVGDEFEETREGDSDSELYKSPTVSGSETRDTLTPSEQEGAELSTEMEEHEADISAVTTVSTDTASIGQHSEVMDDTISEVTPSSKLGEMSAEENEVVEALEKAVEDGKQQEMPSGEPQEEPKAEASLHTSTSAEIVEDKALATPVETFVQELTASDDTEPVVPRQQRLSIDEVIAAADIEAPAVHMNVQTHDTQSAADPATNDVPSADAVEVPPADTKDTQSPSQIVIEVLSPSGDGVSGASKSVEEPSNQEAPPTSSSEIAKVVATDDVEIVSEPNNSDPESKAANTAEVNSSSKHELTESQKIKASQPGAPPVDQGCCTVL